jgi:hypothetical protein
MRMKFIRWLRTSIFKVPEGSRSPKIIMIVYYILFPFNWMYEKRSKVRYNAEYNTYTIHGMDFSYEVFRLLKDEANNGVIFRLYTDGETCTMERV